MKNTQQLCNSSERQGRGTHVGRIKCQVGGLNRNESFDMGPQPDHTTTTELSMVREGDKREGPSTQRMTGIEDGDGLFW
jgi:hypothetical protein